MRARGVLDSDPWSLIDLLHTCNCGGVDAGRRVDRARSAATLAGLSTRINL
jgi:hypothetical protein